MGAISDKDFLEPLSYTQSSLFRSEVNPGDTGRALRTKFFWEKSVDNKIPINQKLGTATPLAGPRNDVVGPQTLVRALTGETAPQENGPQSLETSVQALNSALAPPSTSQGMRKPPELPVATAGRSPSPFFQGMEPAQASLIRAEQQGDIQRRAKKTTLSIRERL